MATTKTLEPTILNFHPIALEGKGGMDEMSFVALFNGEMPNKSDGGGDPRGEE